MSVDGRKIVVLGMLTKMPVAGVAWQTLHYLLGFQRLGYDAYYVEAAQLSKYVPPAAGEELGKYEPLGDLIDLEGETGSVGGE